ncbi:MAG: tail fiber protein [Bacteroidota bacterium]
MDDGMIGEVRLFAGNFAPRNWAFCNGQLLQVSQNDALFSILGTTYGGDGRTTFALPNLQSRVVTQQGSGVGLTQRNLGAQFGTETNTLNTLQMPAHTHTATVDTFKPKAESGAGTTDDPKGAYLAAAQDGNGTRDIYNTSIASEPADMAEEMVSATIGNTGGGQSITNVQPFTVLSYIICTLGTYPSRH